MAFKDETTPWYWHLYRPETLMVYVLILLGLYFYFKDQSDLKPLTVLPLQDGRALAAGFDRNETENPQVKVWMTGNSKAYDWQVNLQANYLQPPVEGLNNQFVAEGERAYLLAGEQTGFGERINQLLAINLDKGELTWTNVEQPVGEAEWVSVFNYKNQLVTLHIADQDEPVQRLFLVGRSPRDGSMTWTRLFKRSVFKLGKKEKAFPDVNHLYLPGYALVNADSIHLVELATGDTKKSWAGMDPEFVGGWVFYQNEQEFRGLELSSLTDTLLWTAENDAIIFPNRMGFTGFYQGFPMHYGCDQGWLYLAGDSLRRSWMETACMQNVIPNGEREIGNGLQNRFLRSEWTDFIPVLFKAANPDSLTKYTELEDGTGARLAMLNLETMSPAWLGKQISGDPGPMTFFSSGELHYLLTASEKYPDLPVLAQFDGRTGELLRAVEANLKGFLSPDPTQPRGGRIWLHNERHWMALDAKNLSVSFTDSDSLGTREVTGEFRESFGF